MKRQVIQTVLNLPGLSGMALIDGRNRPFFLGADIILNSQQQDALAQGIQQVLETTPASFQAFAFHFHTQIAHIYRLDQGLILLILVSDHLAPSDYGTAVDQLKGALNEAPHNAVPNFRLLAGCVTLGSSTWLGDGPEVGVDAVAPDAAAPALIAPASLTVQALTTALNHLSDGATQYLGKIIVVNTWKQSRPANPWLEQWEVQCNGHFSVSLSAAAAITPDQHQAVREWVAAFLSRVGRTIRNFPAVVCDQTLSAEERELLFGTPA